MAEVEDVLFELEGGVAVRHYRYSDVKNLAFHANNINVKKNLRDRFPHPYTEDDSKSWIDITKDPKNQIKSGAWTWEGGSQGPALPENYAIVVDGEAVGSIGLIFGQDVYFRTAEVGYWLGEAHWGKKIMSRVLKEFVQWTWRTFPVLVRLTGVTYEWNLSSRAVLEKAGFVYEGTQKNMVYRQGKVTDQLMFGALRPS